ncbi:MAG: hypothetical protein AAFY15_10290, partial [Cyanobacteria bacterium J06648_11]
MTLSSPPALKPQDIVCLLKLHSLAAATTNQAVVEWTYASLAGELGMSASEVHAALNRSAASHLYDRPHRHIRPHYLQEFLIHGIKYAFPARPGPIAFGIPTAHSAPALSSLIASHDAYVWPASDGDYRGQAIAPLYPSVPQAISQDPILYDL